MVRALLHLVSNTCNLRSPTKFDLLRNGKLRPYISERLFASACRQGHILDRQFNFERTSQYGYSYKPQCETPLKPNQLRDIWHGEFPANFSGEVIHLKTSLNQYKRLDRIFLNSTAKSSKHVNLTFNVGLSVTSIRKGQTFVHGSTVNNVALDIRRYLPEQKFAIRTDNRILKYNLRHSPDVQVISKDTSAKSYPLPLLAVEIGVSRPSLELTESAKEMMEKCPALKVAIIIDIKERPQYENPLNKPNNAVAVRRASGNFSDPDRAIENVQLENPGDPFSPLWLYGARWVGELIAHVQVWTREAGSGKAISEHGPVPFYGRNAVDPQLGVNLRDFIPLDNEKHDKPLSCGTSILQLNNHVLLSPHRIQMWHLNHAKSVFCPELNKGKICVDNSRVSINNVGGLRIVTPDALGSSDADTLQRIMKLKFLSENRCYRCHTPPSVPNDCGDRRDSMDSKDRLELEHYMERSASWEEAKKNVTDWFEAMEETPGSAIYKHENKTSGEQTEHSTEKPRDSSSNTKDYASEVESKSHCVHYDGTALMSDSYWDNNSESPQWVPT
ncbi:hypothetical protein AJ79_03152 [Helicocarpus griseus UAMH5409]|uniref:Uncharacterized protein n=1 Tax=Helicocarpus griseus UAMH5409 TaxID=1447875 RepID=A0A2B7XZ80_9EURO|nr:hypothetical protein AJ79_03152 [Helicocarpus griseus UAMH5409]